MSYHADFWVATTAAAPVIGLTVAISITDTFRRMNVVAEPSDDTKSANSSVISRVLTIIAIVNNINITMQCFVFSVSLQALARGHDPFSPEIAAFCAAIGFFLVVLVAFLAVFSQPGDTTKRKN